MSTAEGRGWPPPTFPGPRWPRQSTTTGRCRQARCWRWPRGWRKAWQRSTRRAWCTGTSSRRTCCWPRTVRGSSTSASPARRNPPSLTQAGLVIGSPGFMSPEQAVGYEVGPPSDIFSLGAVLAFAATGQGPFGTGTTAALLYRVVHGTPNLDRVPAEVRPLIERCLAKDPSQRPTADGLLAEVGALQPTANWLPESIIRAFARDAASGPAPATAARRAGSPRHSGRCGARVGRGARVAARRRHRPRRPAPRRRHLAGKACSRPPQAIRRPPPRELPLLPGIRLLPGSAYRQPPPGGGNRPRRRCGGRWCWRGSSAACRGSRAPVSP